MRQTDLNPCHRLNNLSKTPGRFNGAEKYNLAVPRYTSYPTANRFTDEFCESDYICAGRHSNNGSAAPPLSLYFHIPFCAHLCFYCGCSKILTKNKSKGKQYLGALCKEIALNGDLISSEREVVQLHLGGGTPTFLDSSQLRELLGKTAEYFRLSHKQQRDFSIEIDPRTVDAPYIEDLADMGFNRISIGVQDFDPKVQKAIHREQSLQLVSEITGSARGAGFSSINFDLIYGLPFQTTTSFSKTIEQVVELNPDRISLFNYAHLPDMFSAQRRIQNQDLPDPETKLEIFSNAKNDLEKAGYRYLGFDHFAKPHDPLCIAMDNGDLQRNFQGFTTWAGCDLLAMGVTAISSIGNCFSQNTKSIDQYYAAINRGHHPVERGYLLDHDDLVRQQVIADLTCCGLVSFKNIEDRYHITFKDYFTLELDQLAEFHRDGLVVIDSGQISVLPDGMQFVRVICSLFDRYLSGGRDHMHAKAI